MAGRYHFKVVPLWYVVRFGSSTKTQTARRSQVEIEHDLDVASAEGFYFAGCAARFLFLQRYDAEPSDEGEDAVTIPGDES